jgi:hypothetical protein
MQHNAVKFVNAISIAPNSQTLLPILAKEQIESAVINFALLEILLCLRFYECLIECPVGEGRDRGREIARVRQSP